METNAMMREYKMKIIKGFTLVEMLIVVAIIGIITAFAYPSYMESVRKSNRAEAKTELLDLSQRLQRCYTSLARFNDKDNCPVFKDLDDGGYITRGSGFYKITIGVPVAGNPPETTYLLTATAYKAPQTQDTNGGCDVLTLSHIGVTAPADCW